MFDPAILPTQLRLTPEPTGDLFNWTYSDDGSDFDTLSGLSTRKTISLGAEGDRGYQHHPWIEMHPDGFLVSIYAIHDYDEEGIGMWAEWSYSDDNGDTWSTPTEIIPPQDTVDRREGNTGRVVVPMDVVVYNGKCWAVVDVNDRDFTEEADPITGTRFGVGFLAREIFSNKTLGDIVWIHNADHTASAPAPVDGFPAYSYDAGVRSQVYAYLFQPDNNPKVSFSDQSIYNNRIDGNVTYGQLAEPTTIKPNGYLKVWKYWKNNGISADETYPEQGKGYKVFQFGEDESELTESVIPDCLDNAAIVTRFTKYGDYILISGNSQHGRRKQLFFAVTTRNESTGKYDTNNVYEIDIDGTYNDGDLTIQPDYTGEGKGGGPQSVDVCIANGYIYWIYSQKKENIYMKRWQISGL